MVRVIVVDKLIKCDMLCLSYKVILMLIRSSFWFICVVYILIVLCVLCIALQGGWTDA
jgi:hypothetical protein